MADADDFTIQCADWVRRAGDRQEQFKAAFANAVVNRLKEDTPVVTGRMRAGWHAVRVDDTHWEVVNDVEYARRVNSGFVGTDSLGRQYDQRGRHMVEQVVAEAPQIAAEVLKGLKG